jgi:hypothetical protein
MGNAHWSEDEINILKKYVSVSYNTLCDLLPNRTVSSIRYKLDALDIKKEKTKKSWSSEELSILKNNFSDNFMGEICNLLPGRTPTSIQKKAKRIGLKKAEDSHKKVMEKLWKGGREPRTWSLEEKQRLIDKYPISTKKEIVAFFPGHSYEAICTNANLLGLHKRKEILSVQASKNCNDKRLWESLKGCRPTKPEARVERILKQHRIPLNYVGNSAIYINGLNPDFLGRGKIVEVFGRSFHDPAKAFFKIKSTQLEKIRKIIFSKVGYDCLILWDDELKKLTDDEIADKIRIFISG